MRAFEHTQDLNEAYFLVRGVMAGARSRAEGVEPDLGRAMTDALDLRVRQFFRAEAAA